jgi:hypothetical protein
MRKNAAKETATWQGGRKISQKDLPDLRNLATLFNHYLGGGDDEFICFWDI